MGGKGRRDERNARREHSPHHSSSRTGCAAPSVCRLHSPHSYRLADALQRLLASVFEAYSSRRPREASDDIRDENLAHRGQAADAGGDVDSAAVDVVLLADDVASVEAEVEGEGRLGACLAAGERGFDGLPRAGEDGEDAVAEELAFDGGAAVLADD